VESVANPFFDFSIELAALDPIETHDFEALHRFALRSVKPHCSKIFIMFMGIRPIKLLQSVLFWKVSFVKMIPEAKKLKFS
jgi:hypothetical protein